MPSLSRVAAFTLLIMIVTKLLNIVRDGLLAYNFGTSETIDAYVISTSVPAIFLGIVIIGFSQAYVPCYMYIAPEKREYFFCNTMTILFLFSCISGGVCWAFSDLIVMIIASNMDCEVMKLTSYFIKLTAMVFPFFSIYYVLAAHSQAMEKLLVQMFSHNVLVAGIAVIAAFFATNTNSEILIYGDICAEILAIVVLGGYLYQKGYINYSFRFNLYDSEFIKLYKMAVPLGACLLIDRINVVIDRWFASGFGEGFISALNYADKIQYIPFSVSVAIVLSTCFPRISKEFSEGNNDSAVYYVRKAMGMSLYVGIPIAIWLYAHPEIFVNLFYSRGSFLEQSTYITSLCLSGYSFGVVFYSLREIASRVLSAKLLQKCILYNTLLAVFLNILLNYSLTRVLGFEGIAISTSLTGLVTFITMMCTLYVKKIYVIDSVVIKDAAKILVISLSTIIIWLLMEELIGTAEVLEDVFVRIVIIVVLYILMSFFSRIDIFIWSFNRIKQLII